MLADRVRMGSGTPYEERIYLYDNGTSFVDWTKSITVEEDSIEFLADRIKIIGTSQSNYVSYALILETNFVTELPKTLCVEYYLGNNDSLRSLGFIINDNPNWVYPPKINSFYVSKVPLLSTSNSLKIDFNPRRLKARDMEIFAIYLI